MQASATPTVDARGHWAVAPNCKRLTTASQARGRLGSCFQFLSACIGRVSRSLMETVQWGVKPQASHIYAMDSAQRYTLNP